MFDLTPPGWPVVAGAFALLVAVAGWVTPAERTIRYAVFPAAVALAELVRWNVPFDGVPISTLAMVGVDTPPPPPPPFAMAARLLGSPFLVALMAAAGAGLAALVQRRAVPVVVVAVVLAAATIGGHLAGGAVETVGTVRVAVVQGGGEQNTRADVCRNREVFEVHLEASETIDEPVDLVLWPEDVVHPSPDGATAAGCADDLLWRSEAVERLQQHATALDATLITGWFERSDDGAANVNYSLVISPDGQLGDRYDKVLLVPFGEYVPLRSLIENFSDELPARDVRPGDGPAVLDTELGTLGVSISWEIFFDHRARDAIRNGGLVLLNPTNGSSYWLSIVQTQQVASSRLRAIETDRWVVQAAPTGFSAVIDPTGEVRQRTGIEDQDVLIDTIELREGRTVAVVVGAWPVLLASLAVLGWAHRARLTRPGTRR